MTKKIFARRITVSEKDFLYKTLDQYRDGVFKEGKQPDKTKPFILSAWTKAGKIMNIDQFCDTHNLPRKDISNYRLCTHTQVPTYNITFKERAEITEDTDIDFNAIFDYIKPVKVKKQTPKVGLFDRVVYTDVHIGMTTNKDGHSLYGGKWDELEINERLDVFVNKIIKEQQSNTLYLDELGDFMDGWDGFTTRGGHALPQNMDNQKAYDVGLSFKIKLIDQLIKHYELIVCNNICNDNHAGAFGYVVNSAFKTAMSFKYPDNVEVNNIRRFIDHYKVGKYVFIISHGKDDKALKFGFKPVLDAKQIEKISDYIDEHKLNGDGAVIEFTKGDSHQYLFDNTTSDKFNYYNYPAFSPASEWIQTNFKKGKSGFVCFNYFKDNQKTVNEFLFEWKVA